MKYRTIVADPPWDHSGGTGRSYGADDLRGKSGRRAAHSTVLPYSTLSVNEIARLGVHDLAEPDAHLYLWTTQRYLAASWDVAQAWGFDVRATLVWCKKPMGFFGGPYYGNSTEFCQYCTRGALKPHGQIAGRWFQWPRGAPSERTGKKPEAFLDIVEQVSPGPYLELFARRARFGWSYWGDESLGTAEMVG